MKVTASERLGSGRTGSASSATQVRRRRLEPAHRCRRSRRWQPRPPHPALRREPDNTVIAPPSHSASRTPGSATSNAAEVRAPVDRVLGDRVERAGDERRRSSATAAGTRARSCTASRTSGRACRRRRSPASIVNPVTYAQPAPAPSSGDEHERRQQRRHRRDRDDRNARRDDGGREHDLARQPALEPQQRDDADRGAHAERRHQQPERGRRRRAAPRVATVGPSGTIAPPPINPPASPIITPRTSGFARMKPQPVLDVTPRLRRRDPLSRFPARLRRAAGARSGAPRPGTCRRRPRSRATPAALRARCEGGNPPSQCAMAGERREHHRAERERAERGDQTERVGRRELLGILHDVGDARVLGRAPQQREHLDRERQDDEAPDVLPERQQRPADPPGRCRT